MNILQTIFDKNAGIYNRLEASKKQDLRAEKDAGTLSSLLSTSFLKYAAKDLAQGPFAVMGMATILVAKAAHRPLDISKIC